MQDFVAKVLGEPDLRRMGHAQRADDLNLGLGWLYYALGRIVRPTKVLVIGSFRGFAPMIFAKAVADNLEGGEVTFVDPSLVDGFWRDPEAVRAHFAEFGITNIRHHLMTTQEFVETETYRALDGLGIVFVDGLHTEAQARFDFEAFKDKLAPEGIILLHDSRRIKLSTLYGEGKHYEHGVKHFTDHLKTVADYEAFDLPFGDGVTLVRRATVPEWAKAAEPQEPAAGASQESAVA
jgi:predicted O-methyltransferase YrrM